MSEINVVRKLAEANLIPVSKMKPGDFGTIVKPVFGINSYLGTVVFQTGNFEAVIISGDGVGETFGKQCSHLVRVAKKVDITIYD